MPPEYELPGKLGKLFAAMAEDYGRKGNARLRDLLQKSEYSVEEGATYDNLDGGTYGHAISFQVPGDVFFEIIDNLAEVREELRKRISQLATSRNEFISDITIEIKDYPQSAPSYTKAIEKQAKPVISQELRQDIFDFLKIEKIHWSGSLDEADFLGRLYNLSELESSDDRFPDARNDIWQHRVNNPFDWGDDWVFTDPRFDLIHTTDQAFLRFICETMHPLVRSDLTVVNFMQEALNGMLQSTGWQIVPTKHIGNRPVFAAQNSDVQPVDNHPSETTTVDHAPDAELDRIWTNPGFFRIFLSHKASYKVETAQLKNALLRFGVTCFVAHEDIEPTREWQTEIENALFSMEACIALLTTDFHNSDWTDQEIGVAMGRRVPIISVRLGTDTYGFIGKYQGIGGQTASATPSLAEEIFKQLLTSFPSVQQRVAEALVSRFERADSFKHANELMGYLEVLTSASPEMIERLEKAPKSNTQVENATRVKNRLPGVIVRLREGAKSS